MPIYEYRCQSCGHELEVTQRIVEAPLKECPACKQQSLERLISATSFLLKGGGWYRDGYGSKKEARGDADKGGGDKGGPDKGGGGGDKQAAEAPSGGATAAEAPTKSAAPSPSSSPGPGPGTSPKSEAA